MGCGSSQIVYDPAKDPILFSLKTVIENPKFTSVHKRSRGAKTLKRFEDAFSNDLQKIQKGDTLGNFLDNRMYEIHQVINRMKNLAMLVSYYKSTFNISYTDLIDYISKLSKKNSHLFFSYLDMCEYDTEKNPEFITNTDFSTATLEEKKYMYRLLELLIHYVGANNFITNKVKENRGHIILRLLNDILNRYMSIFGDNQYDKIYIQNLFVKLYNMSQHKKNISEIPLNDEMALRRNYVDEKWEFIFNEQILSFQSQLLKSIKVQDPEFSKTTLDALMKHMNQTGGGEYTKYILSILKQGKIFYFDVKVQLGKKGVNEIYVNKIKATNLMEGLSCPMKGKKSNIILKAINSSEEFPIALSEDIQNKLISDYRPDQKKPKIVMKMTKKTKVNGKST